MAGFNSLGILRQLGLMVGLAASVAIGFAVVLWSQQPDYRVLYANLSFSDANEVIEQLRLNKIPYRFDADGRAILVPESHVHAARLRLAADGFTADRTVGFELLDQDYGMGTSQFMETTRYRRGLEGELSRTISNMTAVRSARVHLAIPRDTVFIRDQRKPRASVFLELFSGRQLERDQVAAIANLVASSIPELDVKDVTIVDQRGRLLNLRDIDSDVVLAARQLEYVRQVEDTLVNRVNSILQPVVGLGNFRAEVSADVDFTEVEQASEMFNPDLPALRSEQTLEERRDSGEAAVGVPGALANQPPGPVAVPEIAGNGAGGAGAGASGSSRNQATRNFELDRSISYTRQQMGGIRRLSVAVVVDDLQVVNPETGERSRARWSDEDLDRLRLLVENSVGFSALRGDSVNVINSSFVPPEEFEFDDPGFWQQEWFWNLLKQIGAAAFVLLLVLGILRPVLKHLSTTGGGRTTSDLGPAGQISAELESLDGSGIADDKVTFGGVESAAMVTPNESFDYQLNEIRSMVAEDPARVAQAIKQWVVERE
ncbi:MAG: flagellar basal-body MS-ring/collar protein FliF [Nitrincola lacisaponensis]|uniref:Flagellar M-ring protein n=1 Tax=Nitrincola lacisaponensis TaxID=267850 RepID=A0A063Y375_9GAMM|nr:flagellar basal-body MS-ring/collar protein FliF [Nitrincola lacisaponensis]KDE39605.1 Flagellar M-ring protein FliF [Nitrincola lacisaponensis]